MFRKIPAELAKRNRTRTLMSVMKEARANFVYLLNKFREWDIDFSEIIIAAPFNKKGFQLNPSRIQCEKALQVPECDGIAMSILAAGYLKLPEAA